VSYTYSLGHFHAYQTINNDTTIIESAIKIWWADERATGHPNIWAMFRIVKIPPKTRFAFRFNASFKVTVRNDITKGTNKKTAPNNANPSPFSISVWKNCKSLDETRT